MSKLNKPQLRKKAKKTPSEEKPAGDDDVIDAEYTKQ